MLLATKIQPAQRGAAPTLANTSGRGATSNGRSSAAAEAGAEANGSPNYGLINVNAKQRVWGKLQAHTQTIVGEKRLKKTSNKTITPNPFQQKVKGTATSEDRSHRITEEIDNIRKDQIKRLNDKDRQKLDQELTEIKHASIFHQIAHTVRTFTIHPKAVGKQMWDVMILLFVIFSSVQIPLLLAFPDIDPLSPAVQVTLDVLFIIDFGMCFRTGYVRPDNEVELDQREILGNYFKTWFWIDLSACFPLDYLFPEDSSGAAVEGGSGADGKALLRLLKLPRLLRLGRLLKFLARFKYAGALKILKFIFMLILVAHWVGCFFFFLMGLQSPSGRGTWMEENVGLIQPGENIPGRYLTMLYASFLMLIGEGMDMETDLEKLYGAFVVLIGTIITAVSWVTSVSSYRIKIR